MVYEPSEILISWGPDAAARNRPPPPARATIARRLSADDPREEYAGESQVVKQYQVIDEKRPENRYDRQRMSAVTPQEQRAQRYETELGEDEPECVVISKITE